MFDFIFDCISGIWQGTRYGWESIAWRWLGGACFFLACIFFIVGWYVPGVLCAAGWIACEIKDWCSFIQELKANRQKKSKDDPDKEQ